MKIFKETFSKIIQNKFIRNVILVASGTAGAQAITMAFSPIITRLYGPEAFGLLGIFTATLSIIMPVAALCYPIAIVLPKADNNARCIAKLSLYIALFMSSIISIIFLFFSKEIAISLSMESITNYMYLIPLAMFFNSLQQIMQQWLIRKKQFKVTARVAISQSIILNAVKSGFGLILPSGVVLIMLATLGNLLYSVQLWFGAKKWSNVDDRIDKSITNFNFNKTAKEYSDFPLYRTPQVFVNAISQSLPVLILASCFGPAVAGFFTLGKSVLAAPATLIGSSVGNVFYSKIAETVNLGRNPTNLLQKASLATFFVGLVPFSIIIVFGEEIFSFVFGNDWRIAGSYAQWMALWVFVSLSARPLIATIPVIKIQGIFLIYEIIFLILKTITLLYASYIQKDALLAVSLYSIVTAISYLVLYIIVVGVLKSKFRGVK